MQITLNNVKIKLTRLEEGKLSTVPRGWRKLYEADDEGPALYGSGTTGVATVVAFNLGKWIEEESLYDGDLWTYSYDFYEALSQSPYVIDDI